MKFRMVFGTPDAIRTHDLQSRSDQARLQSADFVRVSGRFAPYPKPSENAASPCNQWARAYFVKQ